MEKTWETFWTTGKVTDYLTYRNEVTDVAESVGGHGQKEQQNKGKGKNHSVCQRCQTTVEPAAGSDKSLCLWRIRSVRGKKFL